MSDTYRAWVEQQRPIYARLPGANEGYYSDEGGNPADWITAYFDALLVGAKAGVDDVRDRQHDPALCDADWLDYLAALAGYTGEYWDETWPDAAKRLLIAEAFTVIWPNKGSAQVLERLFEIFVIDAEIWQAARFIAGVTRVPAVIGSPAWRYYVRFTLDYVRTGAEFSLARRFNRLFGPAYCESGVVYDGFYAGYSVAGDPVFEAA